MQDLQKKIHINRDRNDKMIYKVGENQELFVKLAYDVLLNYRLGEKDETFPDCGKSRHYQVQNILLGEFS